MNRLARAFAFVIALVALALSATRARADLIITPESAITTVAAGGTGTVSFDVMSTTGDTLSTFGIQLLITPAMGTTSLLQFSPAANQTDPYGNPNYVFAGASTGQTLPLAFWSDPTQTNYPSDTIAGGDSVFPPPSSFVTLGAGITYYLGTVQFQAPVGATPGDTFSIALTSDPGQTYFEDANGNPLNYTPTAATVMVGVRAVPEPGSALSLLAGLSILAGDQLRRRRAKASV